MQKALILMTEKFKSAPRRDRRSKGMANADRDGMIAGILFM